ncbi:GPI-anchored protein LLG1 isoform X1 [Fagus crenata]
MEWNRYYYFCFVFFLSFLLMDLPVSSSSSSPSTFISDSMFESQSFTGRSLLQAKKACPVNFEFLNYTIITSKCKGPKYPSDLCCGAFKEFACPYADVLNDLTNDCATTMFSYINVNGNYPPGLFANECKDGKLGLACPAPAPAPTANENGSHNMCYPSPLLMLIAGFLLLLFKSL